MRKSTLLHLRIPFSYYLLPIFLLALSLVHQINWFKIIIVLVILHVFLYPASNSFNSYYDKDKESIGGLKNPPPVDKEVLIYSLIFDFIALLLGCLISWQFVVYLFIYGIGSKAYSWDKIRLKKYPIISWLSVGIMGGAITFLASNFFIQDS